MTPSAVDSFRQVFVRACLVVAVGLALPSRSAYAYDFGFVRAPSWMDPIVLGLVVLSGILAIVAAVTKPADVPFNALYKTPLSGVCLVAFRGFQASFILLMVVVFIGMGLARM